MNAFYTTGRAAFTDNEIDWDTDDIRASLVNHRYEFSRLHSVLADIHPRAIVKTVVVKGRGIVVTEGHPTIFTCRDIEFIKLPGGIEITGFILWRATRIVGLEHMGAARTESDLLAFMAQETSFPIKIPRNEPESNITFEIDHETGIFAL